MDTITMKEKTKKKRQLILESALTVFLNKGYEKAKIIDIAREAGIGKGTVYEYFSSKEHLFSCLMDNFFEEYVQKTEEVLQQTEEKSCRDTLAALFRMEGSLYKNLACASLTPLQIQMEFVHFPELKHTLRRILQYKYDTLHDVLKRGIAAGELRAVSLPLTTIMLMGATFFITGFAAAHLQEDSQTASTPALRPALPATPSALATGQTARTAPAVSAQARAAAACGAGSRMPFDCSILQIPAEELKDFQSDNLLDLMMYGLSAC